MFFIANGVEDSMLVIKISSRLSAQFKEGTGIHACQISETSSEGMALPNV